MICKECGKCIPYSGELSDRALKAIGLTRTQATREEHPDGICDECIYKDDYVLIDELVMSMAD